MSGRIVKYSKQTKKFLDRQEPQTKKRVVTAIEKLPAGDVKKLTGMPYFRLRVGNIRVIFDMYGRVISIIKIENRGQAYK